MTTRLTAKENADAFPAGVAQFNGLTKLEYAAIHICAGLCANPETNAAEDKIASAAINLSRELIAQLNKLEVE